MGNAATAKKIMVRGALSFRASFGCKSAISRRNVRPSFARQCPSITEGAGNAGCQLHPQPRVRSDKAHELVTTGSDGFTRHSPRNGFTAYFALSSVTTLFDTVACASYRRLDANNWGVGTTRLRRPRQHISSSALTASTASRPTLMTCATPLCRNETGRISELIWVGRKQKYFCKRGLTRVRKIRSDLPVGAKSARPPAI